MQSEVTSDAVNISNRPRGVPGLGAAVVAEAAGDGVGAGAAVGDAGGDAPPRHSSAAWFPLDLSGVEQKLTELRDRMRANHGMPMMADLAAELDLILMRLRRR